jgi:hypothetical protein
VADTHERGATKERRIVMNFLNPIYLFALAAVAVPILIHIFSRRRVPQVPFSTIRFLRRSDRRSMVRINLRRLLLLALRVIGIALVALVFARPVVRGGLAALFPRGGSRAVCILLDRSYSMRVEGDEGTVFDRAKARVASVLDDLDKDDEVSIVLFDTARETIYDGEAAREVVLSALGGLRPSWGGTDLRSAVAFGRRTVERSRRDVRELYVVSDFQRSGLGAAPDSAGSALPLRAFLLPVQASPAANVAIEGVLTPRVTLHMGETVGLKVLLRNTSRELEARFPLEVSVGGRTIMEKEIDMPPASVKDEAVVFPAERSGWVEGVVRKRADRLPADDTRFFTIHVENAVNVLLVADEHGFYLEQALSPEGSEGDLSVTRTPWREFTSERLKEADVVVLGSGRGPSRGDVELVERFVSAGGKAIVLVLPELEEAVAKLSRFSPRVDFTEMPQGYVTLLKPPRVPGFLAPFDETDLAALSRLRFRRVALVSNVPERAIRLKFSTGTPFIWEESRGKGTIIFAAIDPRPEAGELVLSPYFLPLVQQLVLATGAREPAVEGTLVGEPIVWRVEPGEDVTCTLPGGAEIKPERVGEGPGGQARQRLGEQAAERRGAGDASNAALAPTGTVIIPPVEEPGFVTIASGAAVDGVVAVNPDCRRESDLVTLSAREAADSLGLASSMVVEEGDELAPAIHAAREGREISMPLLLAALAIFVAEGVIAQREKGEAA